ncbi:MAG: hypothetical protein ACXAE3_07470 [Candidatus Kariarchaeaceae archaeon]|jgi:predicted  nucleic acid-binding Zn-ribbon protein
MSDPKPTDAEIQVIKQAILGFVGSMDSEKRKFEQQIRERSENVRSSVLGVGATQFSFQDVEGLSKQYKDEYLNIYRNTIHLNILSNGSRFIKTAIQQGLISAEIVQQEWLEGFEALQNQINQYQAIADRAEHLEEELGKSHVAAGDVSELQKMLQEKEQLLAEKDTEIVNLNEGMARMENQVNAMGQNLLDNQMTIEELQEAINDRDVQIQALRSQLSDASGSSAEMEVLQKQLQDAKERERDLQGQVSSAGSELVNQLQDNLEKTREQVLELRRDLVQKNEELHSMRLEQDEYSVKIKQHEDRMVELKEENTGLSTKTSELSQKLSEVTSEYTSITAELNAKSTELETTASKLEQKIEEVTNLQGQLEGYEGKVAMSAEEQERINKEMSDVRSQLGLYQSSINYLKGILGFDVKFKIMNVMSTMSEKVRIDDLSEAVEVPEKVVTRAAIELSDQGFIEMRKEGRFLFCTLSTELKPPQLLIAE